MADQQENEITLTLHGLNLTEGKVLARVFVSEFKHLLDALMRSDHALNQTPAHDYIIVGLEVNSAKARLLETRRVGRRPNKAIREELLGKKRESPARFLRNAVNSIYNGDSDVTRIPPSLLKDVAELAKDCGETFSHGELAFDQDNITRIDDYLSRQALRAIQRSNEKGLERPRYFTGVAYTSFDGILKAADARGTLVRGTLVLSAGGKEIDCVLRQDAIVRDTFNLRAQIDGIAHYNGESALPERLDVKRVQLIERGDLIRWRGALEVQPIHDDAEDDH